MSNTTLTNPENVETPVAPKQELVITFWKGEHYKLWGAMDALYATADSDWLMNIPAHGVVNSTAFCQEIVEAVEAEMATGEYRVPIEGSSTLTQAAPKLFEALEHLKNRLETIQENYPEIALDETLTLAYSALAAAVPVSKGDVERVKNLFWGKLAEEQPDNPLLKARLATT